jgi:hypothetical protein
MMEYFQGNKTEQLRRVIEERNLGCPETVIIHMGTNDLKTKRNPDFVLEEVYAAKRKIQTCRLVLIGVLRSKGVSCRLIWALNNRFGG